MNRPTSPAASRSAPSIVEHTRASVRAAARTRRLATTISIVLASHTVQVISEAITRPINTAFTTGSALAYMPHGLRSRGSVVMPMTSAPAGSCANTAAA